MSMVADHLVWFHFQTVFEERFLFEIIPGSNFFGKTPLFFRYSGVNAANAVNLQAKRR